MNELSYQLPVPDDGRRPLAAAWLLLGILALLSSGLFVILILLSRTPGLQGLFPVEDFFQLAIVVHVDLSVLFWFATVAATFWTLTSRPRWLSLGWAGLVGVALAAVLLSMAAFQPGQAIMSNYVPVVHNSLFQAGLLVFAVAIFATALRSLFQAEPIGAAVSHGGVIRLGAHTSFVCVLLTAVAFLFTLQQMPDYLEGAAYYETLFWGAGHILQFAWTQLMLVAWLLLASASGMLIPLGPRMMMVFLLAGFLPAFLMIPAYFIWDVGSPQLRTFFIWLMAAAGSVATGPVGLALLLGWWRSARPSDPAQRALRDSLLMSGLLFLFGGVLGFMVEASNTIVPAHYHGCIVAVTLAFMAVALHLMPAFRLGQPSLRISRWLPWVYGCGQLLHIAGLAYSGGHGAQRKTAIATQGLDGLAQKIGMGVMGIGGLLAVIGGALFVVAVIGALRRRPTAVTATA